jgi:hypothetical protein
MYKRLRVFGKEVSTFFFWNQPKPLKSFDDELIQRMGKQMKNNESAHE